MEDVLGLSAPGQSYPTLSIEETSAINAEF